MHETLDDLPPSPRPVRPLGPTETVEDPYFYLVMLSLGVYSVYCIARSVVFNFISANPVILILGNCSFAVYLLHRPVLLWFDRLFPGTYQSFMVYWFPNFLITLSLAVTSYYVLEENVKAGSRLFVKRIDEWLK